MTLLNLKDSHIEVQTKEGSGYRIKNISYDTMKEIFHEKSKQESPWLPGEYGLQKYIIQDNLEFYLWLEPARKMSVRYSINDVDADDYYDEDGDFDEDAYNEAREADDIKSDFIAPITAWIAVLEKRDSGMKYQLVDTFVVAMKSTILSGKERVYRLPFSNVYDNERICWGHNDIDIPQIKALQGLSTRFFSAPFNDDLDNNRFQSFMRKELTGNATMTLHFQMEVNKMLEKEMEDQEVLHFINDHLRDSNAHTIEGLLESIQERYR